MTKSVEVSRMQGSHSRFKRQMRLAMFSGSATAPIREFSKAKKAKRSLQLFLRKVGFLRIDQLTKMLAAVITGEVIELTKTQAMMFRRTLSGIESSSHTFNLLNGHGRLREPEVCANISIVHV